MSNEDFERQMTFIIEQQAKFSVGIEKQKERMDAVSKQIEALTGQIAQLTGFAAILKDAFVSLTRHVERHDKQIAANEQAIADLAERGKETDARLNALILIVERHVSSHR